MHPDMLEEDIINEIDSVNGVPVEYPIWCPLSQSIMDEIIPDIEIESTAPVIPLEKLPKIENFIQEVRVKFQRCMNTLTDGDPSWLLKEESNFEMILTDDQEKDILKFAEDLMAGNLDDHYDFILLYDDRKPTLVIFEVIPRHVRASTLMKLCFPKNVG